MQGLGVTFRKIRGFRLAGAVLSSVATPLARGRFSDRKFRMQTL
jgi:hypothetical protein